MKRTLLLAGLCVSNLAGSQTLDLKPGVWEVSTSGGPLPRPVVVKECMSRADIAQFAAGPDKDEDADCKTSRPATLTGKVWSTEKTCPDGRKVSAEFTADSAERVKGRIVISPPGQTRTTVQIDAKWQGTSCKGIP